ncbi:MAG: zinc ribbon domain-containing protein [Acidobacteriota bacterium]|nr:zinc ribbon domain-containing protein [Acidobacteriota bacterium]
MTEPEIARRCPSCGASIRDLASFCPQCGKQLSQQTGTAQPSTSVVTTPLVDVPAVPDPANVADPTRPAVQPGKKPFDTVAENSIDPKLKDPKLKDIPNRPQKTTDGRAIAGGGRARMQRATTLARDVEGDVIHRMQKLREISTVVLDEAGYDPSLRFVLVAAFLFVLFLVIVFLNKLIS